MELDENHHHACKRSRVDNSGQAAKIGHKKQQHQDEDEEDGEGKRGANGGGVSGTNGASHALVSWQNHISSRIYRVSRASGGKDRHSKVYTAKGLRDRRVRLSVSTAIQFYDLQDRLGYDQPSKAIEWLIKAAAAAINELPTLEGFPNPPPHQVDGDMPIDASPEGAPSYNQQQHLSTKSGCSSTSETSKGSGLSLSRSESRVKARERARERAAKDKEKDADEANCHVIPSNHHQKNLNPGLNAHSSFTELLTGGGGNNGAAVAAVSAGGVEASPISIQKQISTADYFGQAGLFTLSQKAHLPSGYSSPSNHFVHSSPLAMMPFNITAAAPPPGDHQEMHQFSFLQDHLIPTSAMAASGDYNLNFSISSGLAGLNRGTLQSNSPSQLPQHHHHHSHNHLERLSTPVDGSNLSFFFGSTTAAPAAAATASAANQFSAGFDGRLQLCYGDGFRDSDQKGKGKS